MPNRIIKESIKSSPQIDELSWFEEVLYYRLIVTADDYGRADGRIVLLKNELFPLKENVTKKAVEEAISHLVSAGLLRRYEVNGMPYLFFPTWEKHQRVRNSVPKCPAPPQNAADDDGSPQVAASCGELPQDAARARRIQSNPIQSESESNGEYACARETSAKKKFVPPTLEEVTEYCRSRNSPVDPKKFYEYFSEGGWKDAKGNPVRNWKQKILTWEKYDTPKVETKEPTVSSFDTDEFMIDALKRTYGTGVAM